MRISNSAINIGGDNIISGHFNQGGQSVSVVQMNGRTIVNGVDVTDRIKHEAQVGILKIVIEEGAVASIQSDVSVEAKEVRGNVEAGVEVQCGDVSGNVNAGVEVNCGHIHGSVRAGVSVNRR